MPNKYFSDDAAPEFYGDEKNKREERNKKHNLETQYPKTKGVSDATGKKST